MFINLLKNSAFFIIIGIAAIMFLLINHQDENKPNPPQEMTKTNGSPTKEKDVTPSPAEEIVVDVKGEVKNPGIYKVKADTRVNEVIQLAGGFSKNADQTTVNLAQKVQDEMVILVSGLNVQGEQASAGNHAKEGGKIRLNYATLEEIETLNGIGPSKAQAILAYREENGLFRTMDDLLNVSGIGEKTLENMRDNIQIP